MPCQVISSYDNCKQFPWNIEEYLMRADNNNNDAQHNHEEMTNWTLQFIN